MCKYIAALMPLPLIFCAVTTVSARNFQPYIGIGVGGSYMESNITVTGDAAIDDEDGTGRILAGFKFTDFFSLETFYADLGEVIITANLGDTFTDGSGFTYVALVDNAKASIETTTAGLGGMFSLPMDRITGERSLKFLAPFFKLGFHSWDADFVLGSGAGSLVSSEDGTDLFWGTGVSFNFGDYFGIRAEYDVFYFDDEDDNIEYIATLGASAIIRF